ncbi:hypothetical protein PENSPDRAFT_671824 [Peniophora sp. CONT]|nr:hypothetical protein PENSPDRAFT_671824 [Peniophora sp. CONT]
MSRYPSMFYDEESTQVTYFDFSSWAQQAQASAAPGSASHAGRYDGETTERHWQSLSLRRLLVTQPPDSIGSSIQADLDVPLSLTSEDVYHNEETTNPWANWATNEDQSPYWARTPWTSHWNGVPYHDDDLGVLESKQDQAGWGNSPSVVNWAEGDGEEGGEEGGAHDAEAAQQHVAAAPRSGYLALLNGELLDDIWMYLAPPLDFVPLKGTWSHGRGKTAIDSIVNLMCTASWVRDSAMTHRRLWGAVTPAAHTQKAWVTVTSRTASAPLRIAYRDKIPTELLNEQLPRAAAVYAGDECSWKDFEFILGDAAHLAELELLFLRPNRRHMPAGILASPTRALTVPKMRVCETNIPLRLVAANRLKRLGCFYHTASQLVDMVTARPALERLDIGSIRGDDAVDLTALISAVSPDNLEFLRFRAGPSRTTSMQRTVSRVQTPCLQVLDVGGPCWIAAPLASFARIYNAHAEEVLDMLRGMPVVERLHLRWRLPEDSLIWVGDRVSLPQLRQLFLDGALSAETETFLRGLYAPKLQIMQMFGDMRAAPNLAVVPALRAEILEALADNGDLENLRSTLQETQEHLSDAGHDALADRVNSVLVPPLTSGWGAHEVVEDVEEGAALQELRDIATAVADDLALMEDAQSPPHAGVLLSAVVSAALAALSPDAGLEMSTNDLHIFEDAKGLQFQVYWHQNTFCLRFTMIPAGDHVTLGNARTLQPTDSPAFGLALLRTYTWVDTLHIDFSHDFTGRQLIGLLSDHTVLPGLRFLKVTAPKYLARYETAWDALGDTVTARHSAGHRLAELVLAGTLCVTKAYAERLTSATDNFVPLMTCGHMRKQSCTGIRDVQNVGPTSRRPYRRGDLAPRKKALSNGLRISRTLKAAVSVRDLAAAQL